MLGIIDYGMGNLGSVSNACSFLGLPWRILTRPEEMEACRAVVLPGVGAFGDCMEHLRDHGFVGPVRAWASAGRPFLGICVGLQALFEGSEESPGVPGIGLLPGNIRRFRIPAELKVPQIGWNQVRQLEPGCPLFRDIPDGAHFYFVHSYYAEHAAGVPAAGTTDYGLTYTSALWRDNVMAVQFHPEKSQRIGLAMLRNFAQWAGVTP
jgi:glutamine amidotransferase